MVTLTIANQAGSAGKTTTAVTLAALLADEGRTVTIIDLDGQANTSWWLGHTDAADTADDTGSATISDVLLRRSTLDTARRASTHRGVELVPASRRLDSDAVELSRGIGGEQRLKAALEAGPPVEVTIIDCPGTIGILTIAALVASDAVITVATPTVKEISGIPPLQATVEDVAAAYNPKLQLGAIVPCIVPAPSAGALYVEALDLLTDAYGDLVTPTVRRSVRVPEAYSQQLALPAHAPRDPVTADYRAVLADLQQRRIIS